MKLPRKIKKGLRTLWFRNRLNKYERKALRFIEGKIKRRLHEKLSAIQSYPKGGIVPQHNSPSELINTDKAVLDSFEIMEMAQLLRGKLPMEIPHDPNEQVEHIKMED